VSLPLPAARWSCAVRVALMLLAPLGYDQGAHVIVNCGYERTITNPPGFEPSTNNRMTCTNGDFTPRITCQTAAATPPPAPPTTCRRPVIMDSQLTPNSMDYATGASGQNIHKSLMS
jgi:hypothetical protein